MTEATNEMRAEVMERWSHEKHEAATLLQIMATAVDPGDENLTALMRSVLSNTSGRMMLGSFYQMAVKRMSEHTITSGSVGDVLMSIYYMMAVNGFAEVARNLLKEIEGPNDQT